MIPMGMYEMTVMGEWDASDGRLLLGRVACEFAADGSVAAMAGAHTLLAALFAPPGEQPPSLWLGEDATLAGVLAVHVRYLEPEDRAPLGFRRLRD